MPRRTRKKRKKSVETPSSGEAESGCLGGALLMLAFLWFYGYLSGFKPPEPTGDQSVDQQIATLDETEQALRSILEHVEKQRSEMITRQEAINDLSERESSIKSFIETNREKVDQILDAAEYRNAVNERKWFWFTAFVSFAIGLFANAVFHLILRRINRVPVAETETETEETAT